MKKFAETVTGKWVLGVCTPLTVAMIYWIVTAFISLRSDASAGRQAKGENDSIHPMVENVVEQWQDFRRERRIIDSVQTDLLKEIRWEVRRKK